MKFVLFVEGFTERKALPEFLKRWLDPRLSEPVTIKIVQFKGCGEYYKDISKKAIAHLNGPGCEKIIAAIGLLDLYGPSFYPANKTSADERYNWAKNNIETKVGHTKFRQHFAVHECEAWLLSDLGLFPGELRSGFPGRCSQPETVNNVEPPKKLLHRLYRDRLRTLYKEIAHGTELFTELDPMVAYGKCPRFRTMLNEMQKLAEDAGLKKDETV